MKKKNHSKKQPKIHEMAKTLFEMSIEDRKHELAEIEMDKGEEIRKEIEFEINLLKRESEYSKEAQMYYDNLEHIGTYPRDFDFFPEIKKELFRKVNLSKRKQTKREQSTLRKNAKLIEKLLSYRIKHETGKFSDHLIPKDKSIKGVTAEISMEVDRLFYIWKRLKEQHKKTPHAKSFGLSVEEENILEKIESGYFEKKVSELDKGEKKIRKKKRKNLVKEKINKIKDKKAKVSAEELAKKVWYRKSDISQKEIDILTKLGYQSYDKAHEVFDFNGKPVACIAYKPEGFRDGRYKADKRESLHHFSRPFLLKELNKKTKVLVRIIDQEGNERTVDAAIEGKVDGKWSTIAVEFQESHKIGFDRVLDKVTPILEKFDKLVIVCQDKYKGLYDKIKTSNIYIVNGFEFKELLKKWKLLKKSPDEKKTSQKQPSLTKKS